VAWQWRDEVTQNWHTQAHKPNFADSTPVRPLYTAPQAECAPREAQPDEQKQADLTEEWNIGFNAGYESALMNAVDQLKRGPHSTVGAAIDHVRKMWVESIAKCEPEEDGSLSVNELFAMQAENAAPTPERAKYDPATQPGDPNFDGAEAYEAHLNAECAPREAQPVIDAKRMTEIARKWMRPDSESAPEFHWGDFYDCVREIIAAPTPERADADTAGAIDWERLYNDMAKRYTEANRFIAELRDERRADVRKDAEREEALKKWVQEVNDAEIEVTGSMSDAYRCGFEDAKAAISSHDDEEYEPTPESDQAADRASRNAMNQLMLIRCVQLWRAKQDMKDHMMWVFNWLREQGISGEALGDSKVNLFVAPPASQERADAGKDAALTDAQLDAIWYALPVIRIHNEADRAGMNSQVALRRAFARAILAANKEPK
jgi:hypothetical protein